MDTNELIGCVGFTGPQRGGNWFQRQIKFWTDSKWSHMFVMYRDGLVLEAAERVQIVSIAEYDLDQNCNYEIYEPYLATPEQRLPVVEETKRKYLNELYGFLQIPWFAYRRMCQLLNDQLYFVHNPFPSGPICSEVGTDQIDRTPGGYAALLRSSIQNFDENDISPEDAYRFVKSHPEAFRLVKSKQSTNQEEPLMSPKTINIVTNIVGLLAFVWEPVHSYLSSQPFNWGTFVTCVLGAIVAYFTGKSARAVQSSNTTAK